MTDVAEMLGRSLIWCAERVAVPMSESGLDIADVSSQQGFDFTDLHAAFIRHVALDALPIEAVLHIFAFTRYRLLINGRPVGRGPCRYENARPEYDSWDVTAFLVPGCNVIAVLAHRDAPTGRIMGHAPGMAAALIGDGLSIVTDESWRAVPERSFGARPVAWASVEEIIDGQAMPDWTDVGFDAGDWPGAVKVDPTGFAPFHPRSVPLLRETERDWSGAPALPASLVAGDQLTLALYGITLGHHRIDLDADAGSAIEVHYLLPEGARSGINRYTARQGRQAYEGGDAFAFDRLAIKVISGSVRIIGASAIEALYPFERLGRFACSDPLLTRLWSICARTLELISEDAYVDCADRERVEWTDVTPPAFECTRVAMAGRDAAGSLVFSDPRLLKGLLQRIILTQDAQGQIKAHTCSERWDIHAIMEDRSCDWVIALRQYVEATDDLDFLRSVWVPLTRLMDWFLERRTARGLVQAREWEVWDNPVRYQVCEGAGLNAFVHQALRHAAFLGALIGQQAQSEAYEQAAGDLAAAFNAVLWDEASGSYFAGRFGEGSQLSTQLNQTMFAGPFLPGGFYQPTLHAALFALDGGLVPERRRARVEAFVLAHQNDSAALMTAHFLFKTLYELDEPANDVAILETMRSKWRPMLDSPWGTAWEDFEGRGSKVHVYGMVPAYYLSAYVLGVRPDGALRERRIAIEPHPGDLAHADGVVVTAFGPVPIGWTCTPTGMTLTVTVPQGCTADLRIPPSLAKAAAVVNQAPMAPTETSGRSVLTLSAGEQCVRLCLGLDG